ncbi:MAG TPA: arginine--tRNA ligase, partial [Solirubrobacteraceae bacterium]|nr:arginine--tRNA ligase [Solirubrobacteraceae bacterium]
MSAPLQELRAAVTQAAVALGSTSAAGANAKVERPKREGQGDYSTNLAMLLAPTLRKPPREIADQVGAALSE